MSVFGSLFTAVSGLTAQGQSLGAISNNIANVSTVGYKRLDMSFSSLVTNESRSTLYSPGSVRAQQNARIDQQGILQQSSSSTDIALSGNGFFVVKAGTSGMQEPLYTRAGSFSEDERGVLSNPQGFFLYGWPLDQDGNLPAGQADISSLVPVDVAFLGGLTQPTTSASMALNLDQTEDLSAYPVGVGFSPDFTRDIRVYDSLGAAQNLIINFKHHESPTAIAAGTVDLSGINGNLGDQPNLDPTDTFDITVAGVTSTITLNGDRGKLLTDLNALSDGSGNPLVFANFDAGGRLQIKARNLGDTVTLTDGAGTPLADGLGMAGSIGVTAAPPPPTLLVDPAGVPNTPNTEGWWQVEFRTANGSLVKSGAVNFSGSGQLNATKDLAGAVNIGLDDINWNNGSELQDITFDISSFNQFSGEYNVITTKQNGAELGLRTGVSIDRDGFVTAQFSNGQSARIYKLPVATFANVNGLSELSGNVYRESDLSGGYNLREAGMGSAGQIESGALEASNVDLADEFSKMIVTQRAYSANTKVITTADEMTAELLRLR